MTELSAFLADYQALIGLLILAGVFLAFAFELAPAPTVAAGGAALFLALGLVDSETALAVFSNSAPVTIAALFIVSGALVRTGVLAALANTVVRMANRQPAAAVVTLFATALATSAFFNNTPVVMILLPVVLRLCGVLQAAPTRLLIPLSYVAILGGTCTLIGTSTNLLVDGVARRSGLEPIGIFSIAPVGLVVAAAGCTLLLLLGRVLLPDRRSLGERLETAQPLWLTELVVGRESDLVGRAVGTVAELHHDGMQVIAVGRGAERITRNLEDELIAPGDRLILRAPEDEILTLLQRPNDVVGGYPPARQGVERRVVKAMLAPNSPLVGRGLADAALQGRYGVTAIAASRPHHHPGPSLRSMTLKPVDNLLVYGDDDSLAAFARSRDFVYVSESAGRAVLRHRAPLALFILAAVIVSAAVGLAPIAIAAMIGAAVLLVTRSIELDEAIESVNGQLLLLIYSMLIIGAGLETSGVIETVAVFLSGLLQGQHPLVALAGLYLLTSVLTELVTNSAVAVIVTPLAIVIAVQMGVDPTAFVIAVMFGASASFATPIGYQTNTLVYGAGAYRFSDFLKIGLPMNLVAGIAAISAIWLFMM